MTYDPKTDPVIRVGRAFTRLVMAWAVVVVCCMAIGLFFTAFDANPTEWPKRIAALAGYAGCCALVAMTLDEFGKVDR